MIELHRPVEDPFSDHVEEELEDLVVSHNIHRYSSDQKDKPDHPLPFIRDSKRVASGSEQIKSYLVDLKDDLYRMRRFTGDACYIDPDTGETC
ncbi:MAG: hypothetical protein R3211_04100 [Balneolaceae bacterium]|nr:hypothetical protein [Balneolaceae bacterium]